MHEPDDYVSSIPETIPPGKVLVHNSVTRAIEPRRRPGTRGFRAWLQAPDPDRLEVCRCG